MKFLFDYIWLWVFLFLLIYQQVNWSQFNGIEITWTNLEQKWQVFSLYDGSHSRLRVSSFMKMSVTLKLHILGKKQTTVKEGRNFPSYLVTADWDVQ